MIPAVNFIGTMIANLDNKKLTDKEFRQFIRNTISIVEKPSLDSYANSEVKESVKNYYPKEKEEPIEEEVHGGLG